MGRLDFLEQYSSLSTPRNYRVAYRDFFELLYKQREPLEDLATKYFEDSRDYEKDVQDFFVSLKGYAPKTSRHKLTALRTLLIENDVELGDKFWKRLQKRIKGHRAVTVDKVPSAEQFRKVLNHLPVHGKALFMSLLSSGMRIGEALQIKPEDLELDRDPAKVQLRGEYTKTGNKRITFISREAREVLLEWLKVKDDYLKAAVARTAHTGKDAEDPRLFPFSHSNTYVMWTIALRKAGFDSRDQTTNRHQIHPHVMRKYFRTKLGAAIPVDVVEALMGHEGYLTEVYRRYSEEEIAKFYKQGESALWIFTEAGEVTKLRKEVEEQRDQLQTIVNGLTAENLELKSRVARTELTVTKLEKHIDSLESTVKRIHETLEKIRK